METDVAMKTNGTATQTAERGMARVEARPVALSATAFEPQNLTDLMNFAQWIAESGIVPKAFRNKPKDIVMVAIRGREIGFSVGQSLAAFNVIDDRPSMSSEAIVAAILTGPQCEYFTLIESTSERATYKTKRRGDPEPVTLSWTIDQARVAGLTEKATWRRTPDAMLRARAAAALGKVVYPDRLLGIVSVEEAVDIADTENGRADAAAEVPEVVKEDVRRVLEARGVSEIQPSDAGAILDDRREDIGADNLKETMDYLRSFCPAKTSAAAIRRARADAEAKRVAAEKAPISSTGEVVGASVATPAFPPSPTDAARDALRIALESAPDAKTLEDVWQDSVLPARREGRIDDADMDRLTATRSFRFVQVPADAARAVVTLPAEPEPPKAPRARKPKAEGEPKPAPSAREPLLPGTEAPAVAASPAPVTVERDPLDESPSDDEPERLPAPVNAHAWLERMKNARAQHIANSFALHEPDFDSVGVAAQGALGLMEQLMPGASQTDRREAGRAVLKAARDARKAKLAAASGA